MKSCSEGLFIASSEKTNGMRAFILCEKNRYLTAVFFFTLVLRRFTFYGTVRHIMAVKQIFYLLFGLFHQRNIF